MVRREQTTDSDQKTFRTADAAIRSAYFWSYNKFLLIVEGVLEDLSSWAEGCPCHGFSREGRDCHLRGRRAPEAAGGHFEFFLQTTMGAASSMFIAAASGLGHNSREWRELSADWRAACDLIEAEVEAKTSNWRSLPWYLCALASPDPDEARACARRAMEMFDDPSTDPHRLFGRHHRMSARFLSWQYLGHRGSDHDPPLRPLLRDFAMGAGLEEPEMKPLREWLGALRLVRIVERATEVSREFWN